MIERSSPFSVPGYHVYFVQEGDARILQELLERCTDYCMLVDGHPPRPEAASELLTDRPEGRSVEDKAVLGIYNQEMEMVGMLDALRNYPTQGDWWIGLMLIDPDYRHHGLGRQVVQSFEGWVRAQGAQRTCLGVVEKNANAHKFWLSAGYEEIERQAPRNFGNQTHVVIEMAHHLVKVEDD